MIETQRLFLKPLDTTDDTDIVRWRNQKEIIDCLFSSGGITISEHQNWFENYLKSNNRIEFVICIKENSKKVGTIGLSNIDNENRKAEYGILLGETNEWGKGYAREASIALIRYGFYEQNLQRIYLKVFSDNSTAIKLYRKLKFKEEGLLRNEIFKDGSFKDVIIMVLLRDEWE